MPLVAVVLGLAGAGVILLSTWLTWLTSQSSTGTLSGVDDDYTSFKVPLTLLIESTVDVPSGGLPIAALLIAIVAAVAVGTLVVKVRWLLTVGGGAAIVIALLFLYQAQQLASYESIGMFDFLGIGPFVTLAGGLLALVGGIVALRAPDRTA